MGDNVLIESIELGPVRLAVAGMEHCLELYGEVLGLRTAPTADGWVAIGSAEHPIYELREEPDARPRLPHTTGLYHVAILLPTRADLARVLLRLIDTGYPIEGAADHGVSEAIYLSDPEGNGIEIYRDRPRHEWPLANGTLAMATDPLDVDGLLGEAGTNGSGGRGMPNETRVGHIHLQVGDLEPAVQFYRDMLGFEVRQHFGRSVAFLSVGGYHHHIGLNTWAGIGAPPPPARTRGLRGFVVRLPSQPAVEAAIERMIASGWECTQGDGFVRTHDPAGNALRLTSLETQAQPG
jgi:catechol 2,3-dioxygenase